MNTEYYVIIAVIVFVVIFGSILIYLLTRPKNQTPSKPTNPTPPNSNFYRQSSALDELNNDYNNVYGTYTQKDEKTHKYTQNSVEERLFKSNSLTNDEMNGAQTLQTTLKLNKSSTTPIIQLSENAMKFIYTLYGNMHSSYKNELLVYDNIGNLIVKINFYTETNKVVINDWHETENIFPSSRPWPKNIKFSFAENMIRMNNIMIYEYPTDDYRIYRYMKIDANGVKEIQLLSINDNTITAEQVIKKPKSLDI